MMKKSLLAVPATFALFMGLLSASGPPSALAGQAAPTIEDVENARRCATETRATGHAFSDVRDSVQAGGTTRAEALLSVAENALLDARSACRANREVTAQLELLADEAEGLRRSLGSAR